MGPTGGSFVNIGNGYTETQVGSSNLRWETSTKTNFGIDAKFLKDKFDMTVDSSLTFVQEFISNEQVFRKKWD